MPQIQQVRKLESNVFTNGFGPGVFKFTLKGRFIVPPYGVKKNRGIVHFGVKASNSAK